MAEDEKIIVTEYVVNQFTPSQYYGLKDAQENTVLAGAPNNWKTRKGAIRWAKKHGYEYSYYMVNKRR